ncbi:MAG: flagellar basal-body MS-ring/collar protein FliF [Paracoccus sp. (in: a-proteobacteria)]|nr:flagellar basal-body MS-ring/collar protein FliF [Paracoccus sp. (in: a-proteobacteria)]
MREIQEFWTTRTRRQRLAIISGFAVSLLLVLAFVALAGRTQMALLYAGLDDAQAAPVVGHLDQNRVAYQLRNGAIWVDKQQRDRLRMELAAQNLPQGGSAGYEILDEMSGFSTTSQMFDAAYWRAKEGELARTILSIPAVRSARVHLTVPQSRGWRDNQPGAASVTVVTDGTALGRAQADAMRHLVSSAVPRLTPDAVSVIDSARGIVEPQGTTETGDREARMKENVERILATHVGAGNAIVELSIDIVTQSETLTERQFDPAQRALISQETEELTDASSSAGNPAVTAASNLPQQGTDPGEQQQSQRAETRQRANYEVGSLIRQVERRPGAIRRLTVAVLINGTPREGTDGSIHIAPRPETELAAIRELVESAVGYDAARGDVITVKSMPFAAAAQAGTQAERGGWQDGLALDSLARLAIVGVFALLALGLTMRALQRRGAAGATLDETVPPAGLPVPAPALAPLAVADFAPPGDIPALSMAAADFDFDNPGGSSGDPVGRLKRLMKERREESVRLLNGWIGEDERSAT